jgi:hypothetical protein
MYVLVIPIKTVVQLKKGNHGKLAQAKLHAPFQNAILMEHRSNGRTEKEYILHPH